MRLQRAEPVQNVRVVRTAKRSLKEECNGIEKDQNQNSRRTAELATRFLLRNFMPDRIRTEDLGMLMGFQTTKHSNFLMQFRGWMQNLKSRRKFPGCFVIFTCGEFCHFAQSNCRKKQESYPGRSSDVPSYRAYKNPGDTGSCEDDECGDAPAAVRSPRTPGARQHKQWRNNCEKKENVIQIHSQS
jgi:hypothetical protein